MPTLTQFSIKHSRLLLCVGLLLTALGLFPAGAQAKIKLPKPPLKGEFYALKVQERGGTFLVLEFKSRHQVVPFVVASRHSLIIAPGFKEFENPTSDFDASVLPLLAGARDTHKVLLTGLKPGTRYYIGIIGFKKTIGHKTGPQIGPKKKRHVLRYWPVINKRIKTLNRKVRIKFNAINMKNDSDDLSDGDFIFYFFAFDNKPNTRAKPLAAKKYTKGQDWIGSGETKTFNRELKTINYNEDILWLAASGMDMDPVFNVIGVAFTSFPSGMVYKGNGSDLGHDWASGRRSFNLRGTSVDGGSYSAQEKYTTSFTIRGNKADVDFKAFGTLDVWYE